MTTNSMFEEDLTGDSNNIIYFIFPLYFCKNLCLLYHQAIYSEGVSATFMETIIGQKPHLFSECGVCRSTPASQIITADAFSKGVTHQE